MLLSIVIPTKGRNKYLIEVVNSIINMNLNNTEIVIQDNNDTDELSKFFVEYIDSNKVVYNHTSEPLSFIANFELAVSLANAEYITVIGDDDIVNPKIESLIQDVCQKTNFDVMVPSTRSLFYIWPDTYDISKSSKLQAGKGLLTSRPFTAEYHKVDVRNELTDFFESGCLDYLDTALPRIYHGVVKRSLVSKIKGMYGHFFGGLTPDIYASIMLSLHTNSVVCVDYPLTIPGACKKSGSAASETGAHTGELKTAPHFNNRGSYTWNKLVPAIYTVETIWAETAIKALLDTGKYPEFVINLDRLIYVLNYKYPSLMKSYIGNYEANKIYELGFLSTYIFNKNIKWKMKKICEKLGIIRSEYLAISDLSDILAYVSSIEKKEITERSR
ncbi:glycosyltransferase [Vibrio maritimus]|uniref:glycosyltransferase n=1 Tax=Vibrio maritimus TaxID=990268 RepID=UPI0040689FDD